VGSCNVSEIVSREEASAGAAKDTSAPHTPLSFSKTFDTLLNNDDTKLSRLPSCRSIAAFAPYRSV